MVGRRAPSAAPARPRRGRPAASCRRRRPRRRSCRRRRRGRARPAPARRRRMPGVRASGRQLSPPSSERNVVCSEASSMWRASPGSISSSTIGSGGAMRSSNVRPAVARDEHGAEHGVEGVEPALLEDHPVQVGLAEPRDHRPRAPAVLGAQDAEELRQRAACGRGGRSRAASCGPVGRTSRKPPTGTLRPFAVASPLDRLGIAALGVDAEEAAVGGHEQLAAARLDLERVDQRRAAVRVDDRGGARGLRGAAVLRPAAGQRDERQGQRLPHSPACASSHSARLVKPTMIASIQYCERTASLGFG